MWTINILFMKNLLFCQYICEEHLFGLVCWGGRRERAGTVCRYKLSTYVTKICSPDKIRPPSLQNYTWSRKKKSYFSEPLKLCDLFKNYFLKLSYKSDYSTGTNPLGPIRPNTPEPKFTSKSLNHKLNFKHELKSQAFKPCLCDLFLALWRAGGM